MDAKEGWAQLSTLRRLVTEPSGTLADPQILQLKCWPFIAAPHIKKHETTWDVKTKLIMVDGVKGKDIPPKDLDKRMDALWRSIRDMLGDDWQVVFMVDKKVIFDSRKNEDGGKSSKKKRKSTRNPPRRRANRTRK